MWGNVMGKGRGRGRGRELDTGMERDKGLDMG